MEEGFCSLEEHMQAYTELFLLLQRGEEAGTFFSEQRRRLEERERRTDIFLPAVCLRECCALSEMEYWTVMLAFCCELEGGLCLDCREKYGASWLSLQYTLHLLSPVLPVTFSYVAGFYRDGSAMRDILDPEAREGCFSQRPLRLSPAAFFFLLTGELPREEWYTFFGAEEMENMPPGQERLSRHEEAYGRLREYLGAGEPLRVLLRADRGCGSHALLRRVCGELGTDVVFVRLYPFFDVRRQFPERLWQTLRLLVRLTRPVVVLEAWGEAPEALDAAEWELWFGRLFMELDGSRLCFLAQSRAQAELVREQAGRGICLAGELTGRQGGREAPLLGRVMESCHKPEELLLPPDCQRQLDTVLRLARAWRGEGGLQVLFHGSSGTGKTMAASVLARQLGLSLFKVELSQVLDKYIGETEKHMDEIFRIAESNRYLLFFDEADALFAKRTAVRDSHDRYANVSAAYLLQRMETYSGILVLATNLKDHFDDAFLRRIRFVIKFRDPDEEVRKQLWKKALEGEPQAAGDVDFDALAAAAALSPARICGAAQVAKLLASCDESPVVTRGHLLEALELEAGKDETAVGRI